jgi:hypothetical protein
LETLRIAYLTICTADRFASASTLAASLAKAVPGARLHVFLVGRLPAGTGPPADPVTAIDVSELPIANFEEMAFRYDALALCCALKPFCLEYVLDVMACDAAIYLDSDILVLHAFDHVAEALAKGAACILTPHITRALQDGRTPDEDLFLTTGAFNLGFAAFAAASSSRAFLQWWQSKTRSHCVIDLSRGLLLDQTFCNLAPCFIDAFVSLNHPAYNVAYWNLAHRTITRSGRLYLVDGEPVRFVHFSGLDTADPTSVSRHQNRFTRANAGPFADLIDDYVGELDARDRHATGRHSETPYAFGAFHSGERIEGRHRLAYQSVAGSSAHHRNPFDLAPDFFDAMLAEDGHRPAQTGSATENASRISEPAGAARILWRRLVGRASKP